MLLELRIRDYAVIEELTVAMRAGLNVLTGETGAGKSVIIGALGLLLGDRADATAVRAGAARATVAGVFDVQACPAVLALLDQHGLTAEDGMVIVRREVVAEGRSRAWINGSPTTVAMLQDLGTLLVDLHGQHEHQLLLRPGNQRWLLDLHGGSLSHAQTVHTHHAAAARLRADIDALAVRAREVAQRADYLRFQVEELERADLRAGEDEELEREARILEHGEDLTRAARRLQHELYAGDEALSGRLAELRRDLEQIVRIDPSQGAALDALDGALLSVQELGRDMGSYADGVDHDSSRLQFVRERLDLLFRLKRKYGPDLGDVFATLENARAELDLLDGAALDRSDLEVRLASEESRLAAAATELSALRVAAAAGLGAAVIEELRPLGLPGAHFAVQLSPLPDTAADGNEHVEFLIAVNAGFEPRPLARVASGGELSRIMLALKTVLARHDPVPTLVFDEIDAGIGGRVAHRVALRLAELAAHHQVFVITHLPQIASRADRHFLVDKAERGGITVATLAALDHDERVREVARLLGGDPESHTSLEHARELLDAR